MHWASAWPTFPADNHPVNTTQIEFPDRTDQRFDGKKPHAGRRFAEMTNPRLLAAILDGNAKPDVDRPGVRPIPMSEKITHQRRPFRQYLKRMPRRLLHNIEDTSNEILRYFFVK